VEATHVKRALKYRFCPTDAQAAELSRTFGCVRKVYNLALAARTEAWTLRQERVNCNATSAMLTAMPLNVRTWTCDVASLTTAT
jgi:putative transposase